MGAMVIGVTHLTTSPKSPVNPTVTYEIMISAVNGVNNDDNNNNNNNNNTRTNRPSLGTFYRQMNDCQPAASRIV